MNILVLCVGNVCRSPYAEALLQAAFPQVTVSSAGLSALHGSPADMDVQRLASEQGIDLSRHCGRQLLPQHLQEANVVFVMSAAQEREVVGRFPFARGRVYRLGECLKEDIPDPYRQPILVHRAVQDLIKRSVDSWSVRLSKIISLQV